MTSALNAIAFEGKALWLLYPRCELRDADAARELSHAFFAEMLAGGTINTVNAGAVRVTIDCSRAFV